MLIHGARQRDDWRALSAFREKCARRKGKPTTAGACAGKQLIRFQNVVWVVREPAKDGCVTIADASEAIFAKALLMRSIPADSPVILLSKPDEAFDA